MSTYYVRSSGGSDGNDGLSFAQAWATIQYAMDNISSGGGDLVLVCADGTHLPTATLDFDTAVGTSLSPNEFRGASATGDDDGTIVTVSGTNLSAGTDLLNISLADLRLIFNGIRFTVAPRYNINYASASSGGFLGFKNCRIDNAVDSGIYFACSGGDTAIIAINSEIDNNGNHGIESLGIGRGGVKLVGNKFHHNTNVGWEETNASYPKTCVFGNTFYRNGSHGALIENLTMGALLAHNVFFANGGSGFYIDDTSSGFFVLLNNIFRLNTGYGLYSVNSQLTQFMECDFNCSHGNTSGHTNINSGVLPGANNVLSNPLFVSETDESEDFNLQSGSPCLNVGFGYNG